MSEPKELKHYSNNCTTATLWKVNERFLGVFYHKCKDKRKAVWFDGDIEEVFYEFAEVAVDWGKCET